jgi:hypothetical protein
MPLPLGVPCYAALLIAIRGTEKGNPDQSNRAMHSALPVAAPDTSGSTDNFKLPLTAQEGIPIY